MTTNNPTSAHRPNPPTTYTAEGTQPVPVAPGVAAKPKLLSRQRNSSFMWWRSSAC